MNKTITMNIRIEESTRKELRDFAAEVGIPATSLVNASIRQMLRNRTVTFSTALEPTPYLEKILVEAEQDIKTGQNITHTKNKTELKNYLNTL